MSLEFRVGRVVRVRGEILEDMAMTPKANVQLSDGFDPENFEDLVTDDGRQVPVREWYQAQTQGRIGPGTVPEMFQGLGMGVVTKVADDVVSVLVLESNETQVFKRLSDCWLRQDALH